MIRQRAGAGLASGLALASGLGLAGLARARSWDLRGDVGAFAAFHFGGPRGGEIGLGLEARGVYVDVTSECGGVQSLFAGAVGRIEAIDWAQLRLTVGPVVGRTNGGLGVSVDATGGVALGRDRGAVFHLGADAPTLLQARLGYAVGRDWDAGVGVRYPPLSWSWGCAVGRPLRRQGRAPVQGANAGLPRAGNSISRVETACATQIWTQRACLEWASVPAFGELVGQLHTCGAPPELIARARAAAADELAHAVASAQVACALGGLACVSLDPPVADRRLALGGSAGLQRLAVESWLDGCVAEGLAADVAERERDVAADAAVRQVQGRIAIEERRHAELAWDILEWALAADSPRVRAALALVTAPSQSGAGLPREVGGAQVADGAAATYGLHAFGILDAPSGAMMRHRTLTQARRRLAERLSG